MIMKTLLSLLFLFTALSCAAQYHNVEGIRVVGRDAGTDSTTVANVGQIQFDADDDKFRFNDGTGWFSYLKEGSISASNGITKLVNDFQLGGDISAVTSLNATGVNFGIFADYIFGGSLTIGNGFLGTAAGENEITWDDNGATITGAMLFAEDPSSSNPLAVTTKGYQDTHLAGTTIAAGSTATAGQYIRKGVTNFEYVSISGSGLTNSSGDLNVTGNVSVPIAWTWNNTGTRPSFTVGESEKLSGKPFDSVAMYTKANGFTFEVAGSSDIKKIIFKTDSGFVYHKGVGEVNPPLMYYANDYSGSSRFNDRALVDKGYVDNTVSAAFTANLNATFQSVGIGAAPSGHLLHVEGGTSDLFLVKASGTPVFEASVENGRPTITVGDINMVGDLIIDEGTNRIMGTATLSSGTVTVNTTKVTANSRIFLTINGGTLTNVGTPYVSARSPGTSFTITSTNSSDASDVAWLIIEPQ